MIRFRQNGPAVLTIEGDEGEFELFANDLQDLVDGRGDWIAVSGEPHASDEDSAVLESVIFRKMERTDRLVPAAESMVECHLSQQQLQLLIAHLQPVLHGSAKQSAPRAVVETDSELRISIRRR